MTSHEMLEKLSNPRRVQVLETRNGTRVIPLMPAQLDYRDGPSGKECYRLCQLMPIEPQRLEWINVKNIREVKS
jgi:hypothetical protein